MQPHSARLFRALARAGLVVTRDGPVWSVRLRADPHAPPAEILLPDALPLEARAVEQLAHLAAVRHPSGGGAGHVCATPDFHPGDSGVAIGSVFASGDVVVPQAVGSDINCGMRLHATDITVDRLLARKDAVVERLRGDFLLGTRDVVFTSAAMAGLFRGGIPAWAAEARAAPHGMSRRVDWDQVQRETSAAALLDDDGVPYPRVHGGGGMEGDLRWAPPPLIPDDGLVRDEGLATIGRGNHFVELQVVDEILDRALARAWGLRAGRVVFMVHTGSRKVGKWVGGQWLDRARAAWPAGHKHPESKIFPLRADDPLAAEYLRAEATAANFGFVNRMLLAEIVRQRLREAVDPGLEAPLVYDLPHNLTTFEDGRWVARKGACPAWAGRPVIVPGSMGAASYVGVGRGSERFLRSASHGAGRAAARGEMGRAVRDAAHARALGLDGVECVTLREERRVEEAPAAYKPIGPVIDAQVEAGVLGVVARLRPLLTFKA